MKNIPITDWCQAWIKNQVKNGDICIDATMGNGKDTLLLSRLAGEAGKVIAFDIQEQALKNTLALLKEEQAPKNYNLLLKSHEHIAEYAEENTVSCITYNFGYLPGADHDTATQAASSLQALESSLPLLQKGGILSLCIYSGGDTGFEEKEAILDWLKQLPPKKYLVVKTEYYNRPNNPPMPVLVIKL